MIQLIAGCKAFHSEFPKTKFEVQDLISSISFDQNWNLHIQMERKWVANKIKQVAREMIEYTRRIWWRVAGSSSVAKNDFYKNDFDFQPLDWMQLIAMDGSDDSPFHESTSPSNGRLIAIEGSRCDLIACVRETSFDHVH